MSKLLTICNMCVCLNLFVNELNAREQVHKDDAAIFLEFGRAIYKITLQRAIYVTPQHLQCQIEENTIFWTCREVNFDRGACDIDLHPSHFTHLSCKCYNRRSHKDEVVNYDNV